MSRFFIYIVFVSLFLFLSCEDSGIVNPSENLTSIPILEVLISNDDYERMLNNRTNDPEIPAKFVYQNNTYSGIIETSGAGSRYHPKWSYTVELNDALTIEGSNQFNLSAQVFDPTLVYTTVASHLYKQLGFEIFRSKHVFLKINNVDQGLYPLIEKLEKDFFEKRNLPVYELYKLGFKSKFSFEETNYPEYNFEKKIPDNQDNFTSLYDFIYARDTSNSAIIFETFGKYLDIDQYIRYHAITTLMNNYDAFTNNFFLYKRYPNSKFEIIPWDFDKIFQPYNYSGLAGKNEIITKLFENDSSFNAYKKEVHRQLKTIFTKENIFPIIDSTAVVIKDGYNLDPYLGKDRRYIFDQEIDNLKNYIIQRIEYFENNLDDLAKDYFK